MTFYSNCFQGQKIRAARRKRKQNRRLEQERRREWRKLHRNKETGDYDEYGNGFLNYFEIIFEENFDTFYDQL